MQDSKPELPTFEEVEDSIPDDRKELSFGGPDENVIDVMEKSERESHYKGKHPESEHPTCPLCKEERGEV